MSKKPTIRDCSWCGKPFIRKTEPWRGVTIKEWQGMPISDFKRHCCMDHYNREKLYVECLRIETENLIREEETRI